MSDEKDFVVPTTKAVAAHDPEWEKFLASQMASSPTRTQSPCGIKFHGDTGKYSLSYFDSTAKETKFIDLAPWSGVILGVKWFVKWKYAPDSKYDIRTREFSWFRDEPVTLLKIDKQNRDKAAEEKVYKDYAELKSKLAMPVPMSDEVKYPFDLFASVYVYAPDVQNPVEGKVVRYRFSGTTRSAFFDYQKAVQSTGTSVLGTMTSFGASEPIKKPTQGQDGKEDVYYSGTFAASEIPAEMRKGVMEAFQELNKWFKGWEQNKEQKAAELSFSDGTPLPLELPVKNLDEEEIDVKDIPF